MAVEDHVAFYATVKQMDDEQLFALFRSINSAQILAIVSIATGTLALREYIVYLRAEWRTWKLLFQRRIMPARLAIIATRYGYLGAFVSAVIFQLGRPNAESCLTIYRAVFGLYVILWASAGSIFLMRLSIIYSNDRRVMVFFTALWLACMGLWIYVVTLISATPVPHALQYPYGPTCQTGLVPRKSAIAWAGSIVFDSAVFLATLLRFRSISRTKVQSVQMRSRKWLFQSNLYYFGASLIFNTTLMLSSLLVNDPVLSNLGSGCAFAVHAIMTTRLVYEAKGWSRDDTEDENDMILNTYNRKKNGSSNGGRAAGGIHPISRIAYSVEETVVRSMGGGDSEGDGDEQDRELFDSESRRQQRRRRHFNVDKSIDNYRHDDKSNEDPDKLCVADSDKEMDTDCDVEQGSRHSMSSVQNRIKGVRGKYFGSSTAARLSQQQQRTSTSGDGESVDQQEAKSIAARRARSASSVSARDPTMPRLTIAKSAFNVRDGSDGVPKASLDGAAARSSIDSADHFEAMAKMIVAPAPVYKGDQSRTRRGPECKTSSNTLTGSWDDKQMTKGGNKQPEHAAPPSSFNTRQRQQQLQNHDPGAITKAVATTTTITTASTSHLHFSPSHATLHDATAVPLMLSTQREAGFAAVPPSPCTPHSAGPPSYSTSVPSPNVSDENFKRFHAL